MNEIEQIPLRNSIDYQRDSSGLNFDQIKDFFLENLLDKWKYLARELDVNENDIDLISKENLTLKQKFSFVRTIIRLSFVLIKKNIFSNSIDFGYRGKNTSK